MKGINGPIVVSNHTLIRIFSHHFPQLRELTCSFAIMPFDFNVFSGLLLPAFIQGVLFAILCWYRGRRQERLSDILLGWLLFLNAVKIAYWMLGFAGWYDTHDRFTSFMFYFPFENLVWMGPLLYFYFLSLTNSDFRFKRLIGHTWFYPYPWFYWSWSSSWSIFPFIILLSLERNINLEPRGLWPT